MVPEVLLESDHILEVPVEVRQASEAHSEDINFFCISNLIKQCLELPQLNGSY